MKDSKMVRYLKDELDVTKEEAIFNASDGTKMPSFLKPEYIFFDKTGTFAPTYSLPEAIITGLIVGTGCVIVDKFFDWYNEHRSMPYRHPGKSRL